VALRVTGTSMTQADWFSSLVLRFLALSARAFGLQHRLVTELSADDTKKMSVALPSSADVARLIQKRRSVRGNDVVSASVHVSTCSTCRSALCAMRVFKT
jgi:hypothetical protein